MSSLRILTLLSLAVLVMGCGRFRKAKECGAVAKTVSSWLANQPAPSSASSDSKTLAVQSRATARRYEELDRALAALDVRSPDLSSRLTRYRKLATDSARALEDVAQALDTDQAEAARKKRVEFDGISREEVQLVAEINDHCRR